MIEITQETTLKTRQHFIDLCRACIDNALKGKIQVNDWLKYYNIQMRRIEDFESGLNDNTFTFQQMAVYIQTGVCYGLLGNGEITK